MTAPERARLAADLAEERLSYAIARRGARRHAEVARLLATTDPGTARCALVRSRCLARMAVQFKAGIREMERQAFAEMVVDAREG